MSHASNVVQCDGPDAPHAFDVVPLQPRNGSLDARCPKCRGHGAWNSEIDLISFRCKRTICDECHGAGWVETGSDPVALPDIELGPDGVARWTTRYLRREDVDRAKPARWQDPEPCSRDDQSSVGIATDAAPSIKS